MRPLMFFFYFLFYAKGAIFLFLPLRSLTLQHECLASPRNHSRITRFISVSKLKWWIEPQEVWPHNRATRAPSARKSASIILYLVSQGFVGKDANDGST